MTSVGTGGEDGFRQRKRSTAALEMVRKDLSEFGCTMQKDTSHAVEVTSTTLKDSMKAENRSGTKEKLSQGLNSLLDGISKAIAVPPDDEGQIPITVSTVDLQYDRAKARLHAIQVNPETYLGEPEGTAEEYRQWCEGFDLDSSKGEISELLVAEAGVRALYTKLVPARVSHVEFWRRYFYKKHRLDEDQARKKALIDRVDQPRTDSNISWDNDWSSDEEVEDSGSDWEKLPRPNQTAQPADLSQRLAASATDATPNTAPSQQETHVENTTEPPSQASPVLPVPLSADGSPADLRHSAESESSAAVEVSSSSGEAGRCEEGCGTFMNIHPKADDSGAVPSGRGEVGDQGEAGGRSGQKESVSRKVEHNSQVEPMSSPTEPVSKEMEPASTKTEPVSSQAEPVSSTAEPMSKKVEPVSSMTEPMSKKVEPVSKVAPVSSMTEPMSKNVEAVSSRAEPVSSTTEPGSKELQPVSSTTEPVSREAESASSPAEAASSPAEAVSSPAEAVSSPAESVSSPAESVSSPAESVSNPAEAVSSPAEAVSSLTEKEKKGRVEPSPTPVTIHSQDAPETASASATNQIKEPEPWTGQTEQSIPATAEGCKADSGEDDLPWTGQTEQSIPATAEGWKADSGEDDLPWTGQTEQSIPATAEGCEADSGEDDLLTTAHQKRTSSDGGDSASAVPADCVGATSSASALEEVEDWDEDLDVELTEDDMKAAEELAKTLGENVHLEEDDWENWE